MKIKTQNKKQMTLAEKKAFRAGMSHGYQKGKDKGFSMGLEVADSLIDLKTNKEYNKFK